ncbi:MAG: DUF1178 family protein [Hyphomicrobiaceae bacterium]
MIRYRLQCGAGHEFESWFRSSDDFDGLKVAGRLTCAVCGGDGVDKTLMAPRIGRAGRDVAYETSRDEAPAPAPQPPATAVASPSPEIAAAEAAMRAAVRTFVERVRSEAEYVGPRFAQEARSIHAEQAEERPIYGEATAAEVRDLAEDGIDVLPLPSLPKDH